MFFAVNQSINPLAVENMTLNVRLIHVGLYIYCSPSNQYYNVCSLQELFEKINSQNILIFIKNIGKYKKILIVNIIF